MKISEKQFTNFALVKSLYDERRNLLDTYSPFILQVFENTNGSENIDTIKAKIKERFNLVIPTLTLKSEMKRMEKEQYISEVDGNSGHKEISEKGRKYLSSIPHLKDVERKIGALLTAFKEFIKEKELVFKNDEEILSKILYFIHSNIVPFSQLICNPNTEFIDTDFSIENDKNYFVINRCIVEFIKHIDKNDPDNYNMVKEIVRGCILWSFMQGEEREKMIRIEDRFSGIRIFFDTNVLISLLGFHTITINNACKELFELIKSEKQFKLSIASVTIKELKSLFTAFKPDVGYRYYPESVNSIISNINKRGWRQSDLETYISFRLEEEIKNLGLEIQDIPEIKIEDVKDKALQEEYYDIASSKNSFSNYSAIHDFSLIRHIRRQRVGSSSGIENCKCLFLTSNSKLYNLSLTASRKKGVFPEVMLDSVFTNILWLKNPDMASKISLNDVIALHTSDFLVKESVWNSFVYHLTSLKKQNIASEEEYNHLIADNQLIQRNLVGYNKIGSVKIENVKTIVESERAKMKEEARLRIKKQEELRQMDALLKVKNQELSNKQSEILEKNNSVASLQGRIKNQDDSIEIMSLRIKQLETRNDEFVTFRKFEKTKDQWVSEKERWINTSLYNKIKKLHKDVGYFLFVFSVTFAPIVSILLLKIIGDSFIQKFEQKGHSQWWIWGSLIGITLFELFGRAYIFNKERVKKGWEWFYAFFNRRKRVTMIDSLKSDLENEFIRINPAPKPPPALFTIIEEDYIPN